MNFAVNTQSLRDASSRARATKDNRYLAQLRDAENSVRSSNARMVPVGGGSPAALNGEVQGIMRTAHAYGRQVDAHCDFLNSVAASYESAEGALIKQANSLPTAFGWRA